MTFYFQHTNVFVQLKWNHSLSNTSLFYVLLIRTLKKNTVCYTENLAEIVYLIDYVKILFRTESDVEI